MSPRHPTVRRAAASLGGLAAVALSAAVLPGAWAQAPAPTTPAATTPSTSATRLKAVRTFAPALGTSLTAKNVKKLATRDLVVVDGEDASAGQVARLKRNGALVLGYLSVGTVESWRHWFPLLEDHRLAPLGDWPGERFTDVNDADARDALADSITPELLSKGFDGLFLDNVDLLEAYPAQKAGLLDVVTRISARVHGAGGVLMAQNGDDIIAPFVPLLDGWNREDPTGTYDFDRRRYLPTDVAGRRLARHTIRMMRAAGLTVTTIDYFGSPTSANAKRAVRIACKAGAVPYVGDIALKAIPKRASRCDSSRPA